MSYVKRAGRQTAELHPGLSPGVLMAQPVQAALTMSWPDGSVSCPGDREPKAEGYCEFTVTEGDFMVTPRRLRRAAGEGDACRMTGQHTVANVIWRRLQLRSVGAIGPS